MMRTVNGGLTFTSCGLSNSVPMRNVVVSPVERLTLSSASAGTTPTCRYTSPPTTARRGFRGGHVGPVRLQSCGHQSDQPAGRVGLALHRRATFANGGATWETVQFNFEHDDIVLGFRVLFDPVHPRHGLGAEFQRFGFCAIGRRWRHLAKGSLPVERERRLSTERRARSAPAGHTRGRRVGSYGLVEYQVAPDLAVTLDAPAGPHTHRHERGGHHHLAQQWPALFPSAADVALTLPAFLSAPVLPAGCTNSAGAVHCLVTPVRVNQATTIAISLVASATPGSGNVAISVSGHEADPVSSNNAASVAVQSQETCRPCCHGAGWPDHRPHHQHNSGFHVCEPGPRCRRECASHIHPAGGAASGRCDFTRGFLQRRGQPW